MKNPTLKKFLIFQETELSSLKPKKPCYFQEGTYRTEKSNKNSASKKISCDVFVIYTAEKHRNIPYDYLNVM